MISTYYCTFIWVICCRWCCVGGCEFTHRQQNRFSNNNKKFEPFNSVPELLLCTDRQTYSLYCTLPSRGPCPETKAHYEYLQTMAYFPELSFNYSPGLWCAHMWEWTLLDFSPPVTSSHCHPLETSTPRVLHHPEMNESSHPRKDISSTVPNCASVWATWIQWREVGPRMKQNG